MRLGKVVILGLTVSLGFAACDDESSSASGDIPDTLADTGADTTAGPLALRTFVTTARYTLGGGVSGADAHCMGDVAKPDGTSTYKALIGASTRRACTDADCASGAAPLDWVLAPGATYYRADGTTRLFTANADGIFTDWPMNTTILPGGGINQLSGLDQDWTVRTDYLCGDWLLSEGRAGVGWTEADAAGFLQGGDLPCDTHRLLCIEQP